MLQGFPPKVIWLQLGNCTTGQVEALLRQHFEAIQQMIENGALAF